MYYNNCRFLDPLNDFAFKKVFTTKGHEYILISFLNTLLKLYDEYAIQEVEVLPPEQHPPINAGRFSICDIKCKDQRGEIYIVEVQRRFYDAYLKRVQFYASSAYITQIPRGSPYRELKPVVVLSILDHILFKDIPHHITFHRTEERETKKNYLADISYVFIELPKYQLNHAPATMEEHWMHLLKNWDHNDIPKGVPVEIQEALKTLQEMHWSKGEMEEYFRYEIKEMDTQASLEQAEQDGLKKGLKQGLTQGREEGEIHAKKEMAKKLLDSGMSIDDLMGLTGLSKEMIKML